MLLVQACPWEYLKKCGCKLDFLLVYTNQQQKPVISRKSWWKLLLVSTEFRRQCLRVRFSCVFMISMVLFIKVNERKTRVIKTSLLGSYLNLNKRLNEFSISYFVFAVKCGGEVEATLIMAAERFQSRFQNSFQLQFILVENKKQNQVFNYFLFQSMTLALAEKRRSFSFVF